MFLFALGVFTGCESTDGGSGSSTSVYYGVGFSDPWYYGGYYHNNPNIIVTPPPPGGRPIAPPRPERPAAAATGTPDRPASANRGSCAPADAVDSVKAAAFVPAVSRLMGAHPADSDHLTPVEAAHRHAMVESIALALFWPAETGEAANLPFIIIPA